MKFEIKWAMKMGIFNLYLKRHCAIFLANRLFLTAMHPNCFVIFVYSEIHRHLSSLPSTAKNREH